MTRQPATAEFQSAGKLVVPPPRSRAWRRLAYGLSGTILAAVLGGGAYFLLRPPAMQAVRAHIGPAVIAVYASGTVEASVMLPVSPRVGGKLVSLMTDEHSQVRKGQVLARLESEDLAGNIVQLKANAAFAQADMRRATNLMNQNAIARQAYERAVADWKMADGALRQAQAEAGLMTLSAPDDCMVIERDGEVGQFIAANTPVLWLSCHSLLRISAQVDEEDIPQVKVGKQVLVRADAFPGKTFEAKVAEVTPKGDPVGRSYRVRIALPPSNPLQIGMTTEANIIISMHPQAVLLPAGAVADGKVWKVTEGRAVQHPVTVGVKTNDWAEILSGLTASETVLRDGAAKPKQGTLRIFLVKP